MAWKAAGDVHFLNLCHAISCCSSNLLWWFSASFIFLFAAEHLESSNLELHKTGSSRVAACGAGGEQVRKRMNKTWMIQRWDWNRQVKTYDWKEERVPFSGGCCQFLCFCSFQTSLGMKDVLMVTTLPPLSSSSSTSISSSLSYLPPSFIVRLIN